MRFTLHYTRIFHKVHDPYPLSLPTPSQHDVRHTTLSQVNQACLTLDEHHVPKFTLNYLYPGNCSLSVVMTHIASPSPHPPPPHTCPAKCSTYNSESGLSSLSHTRWESCYKLHHKLPSSWLLLFVCCLREMFYHLHSLTLTHSLTRFQIRFPPPHPRLLPHCFRLPPNRSPRRQHLCWEVVSSLWLF